LITAAKITMRVEAFVDRLDKTEKTETKVQEERSRKNVFLLVRTTLLLRQAEAQAVGGGGERDLGRGSMVIKKDCQFWKSSHVTVRDGGVSMNLANLTHWR
jgi:hypothetical protein